MTKTDYSVVIPVYRGEKTICELANRIGLFFASIDKTFEIIFVYDCGPDNSWDVICKLKKIWRLQYQSRSSYKECRAA